MYIHSVSLDKYVMLGNHQHSTMLHSLTVPKFPFIHPFSCHFIPSEIQTCIILSF